MRSGSRGGGVGRQRTRYGNEFVCCRRSLDMDARVRLHGLCRRPPAVLPPGRRRSGALDRFRRHKYQSPGSDGLWQGAGHNLDRLPRAEPPRCQDALIRDDWDGFAGAIVRVRDDERLATDIGAEAGRMAATRFEWRKIADVAYASYASVATFDSARDSTHRYGTSSRWFDPLSTL